VPDLRYLEQQEEINSTGIIGDALGRGASAWKAYRELYDIVISIDDRTF